MHAMLPMTQYRACTAAGDNFNLLLIQNNLFSSYFRGFCKLAEPKQTGVFNLVSHTHRVNSCQCQCRQCLDSQLLWFDSRHFSLGLLLALRLSDPALTTQRSRSASSDFLPLVRPTRLDTTQSDLTRSLPALTRIRLQIGKLFHNQGYERSEVNRSRGLRFNQFFNLLAEQLNQT